MYCSLNYLKHKPEKFWFIDIDRLFLQQLIIEGGTAIAVFVRCFVDKKGMEIELKRRLYVEFPQWALATISV